MKKVNELKAGALLSYVNLAITCIIPLLYTPIMLRILGQSEYGLYSLSNSVISYLTILNLGMGSAIMRYVTKARAENNKKEVNKVVGQFVLIYVALAILVIIVGSVLTIFADEFFAQGLAEAEISKLRILMIIMSCSTAVSFPVSVYSSVAIAYERYIFRRLVDMAGTIASPALNLVVLFAGGGSVGMALVGLGIQIAYAVIFIPYCIKELDVKANFRSFSKELLKDISKFSAFVFLSMIVDMLYWSTDKVLIGAMLGSVAVAIYNVGGTFTSMLQNMSAAISNVFVPRVTTMVVKDTPIDEVSELLIRIGRIQYLIVSLILSGYIVFGKVFIHFWSGDEYADAYFVALWTMIPLAIPLIQNIAYNTILAQKKHQFRAIIYAVIAVINVVSTYLVIPKYGIVAAAVCTGASYLIGNGLIMNIYYFKVTKLNIPKFWINIGKMSLVPAILIIIGYELVNYAVPITTIYRFLLEVIIYTCLFAVGSWGISMNRYEKDLILDLIKKFFRIKNKTE